MFGDKWKAAVLPLQILTLNGIVRTFSATSGEVFQALHKAHYRVYVEVSHLVLVVPALVVGAKVHGIAGVAGAVVFVNLATGLPVLATLMRMLDVSLRDLALSIGRPAIGWALMVGALLLVLPLVPRLAPAVALALLVAIGGAAFAVGVALFARDLVRTMWLSLRGTQSVR
jgi:lipopolysaccharide exporter